MKTLNCRSAKKKKKRHDNQQTCFVSLMHCRLHRVCVCVLILNVPEVQEDPADQ